MKKGISITLPIDMIDELKDISRLSRRTLSSQIEMFLEEALKGMNQHEKSI